MIVDVVFFNFIIYKTLAHGYNGETPIVTQNWNKVKVCFLFNVKGKSAHAGKLIIL
jgi:hypothetical protein